MRRLLLGLGLVLALTAAVVSAQRQPGQDDMQQAVAVADRLDAPGGARPVDACSADGLRACWHTTGSVMAAADAMAASLAATSDMTATRTCDRVPVGTTGLARQADACFVRTRFGDHGVFVFIDPLTERDAQGVGKVVGAQVSVQAS